MIAVIATIQVADGHRDEFLQIFNELMPQVHAEAGCLEYFPAVDVDTSIDIQEPVRGNYVTVLEKWESPAALETHWQAPHMDVFRRRVEDIVDGLTIQVVQPAS